MDVCSTGIHFNSWIDGKTTELKEVRVYKDGCRYYMWLRYTVEDGHLLEEVIFPKVELPFTTTGPIGIVRNYGPAGVEMFRVSSGDQTFRLLPGEGHDGANHAYYTVKTLKEKTAKMTVAEIEKKLGYKIEIVAEDEKHDQT